MTTRFWITGNDRHGTHSIMVQGPDGKGWRTAEDAAAWLTAMREVNSPETIALVYHDPDSLRVSEIECYDHGDPKRTVIGPASEQTAYRLLDGGFLGLRTFLPWLRELYQDDPAIARRMMLEGFTGLPEEVGMAFLEGELEPTYDGRDAVLTVTTELT